MTQTLFLCCAVMLSLVAANELRAQQGLSQVQQDFSTDPGWEGVKNRIIAADPPRIKQDFGWSKGKIGGIVWQSKTPAYYALPLDKALSYDDRFSFECTIAFLPVEKELSPKASNNAGNAYIGFFNHERQGYRPWSSAA